MWQAVEIGWTKSKEAPADWDDAKIKVANFNSRALNALFNANTNEEFKWLAILNKIAISGIAGHTQQNCYKWLATQQSNGMIASGS